MSEKSNTESVNASKANDKASSEKPKSKKVDGTFAEAWKPEDEGETLVGVYLGAQDAMGTKGSFKAYHIKDLDGKRWSVSGASLNTIMPQIPRKTEVTITYGGTMKQGKGDMKIFEVTIPKDVALIDPFEDDD